MITPFAVPASNKIDVQLQADGASSLANKGKLQFRRKGQNLLLELEGEGKTLLELADVYAEPDVTLGDVSWGDATAQTISTENVATTAPMESGPQTPVADDITTMKNASAMAGAVPLAVGSALVQVKACLFHGSMMLDRAYVRRTVRGTFAEFP